VRLILILGFAISTSILACPASAAPRPRDALRERIIVQLRRHEPLRSARGLRERLAPVDEGPLLIAGHPFPHELSSARRLARALFDHYGVRLVLITNLAGVSVPTFDGLVLNADDEIVANFSLKTRIGVRGRIYPLEPKLGAQIEHRYHWGSWVILAIGHRYIAPKDMDAAFAEAQPHIERAGEVAAIFGIGAARPTWVLVDAPGLDDAHEFLLSASRLTLEFTPVHAVSLATKDFLITTRGYDERIDALVAPSACELGLNPPAPVIR
jgi:hypothetical protein